MIILSFFKRTVKHFCLELVHFFCLNNHFFGKMNTNHANSNITGVHFFYSDGRVEHLNTTSEPDLLDNIPIPALTRNNTRDMDHRMDTRVDAILRRFSWFANPDEQWPDQQPGATYHRCNQYHLRRRPRIQCPACLQGILAQLPHAEGPHGCLFSEEVVENE